MSDFTMYHGVLYFKNEAHASKDKDAQPGETSSKDGIGHAPVTAYVFHVSQTEPLTGA